MGTDNRRNQVCMSANPKAQAYVNDHWQNDRKRCPPESLGKDYEVKIRYFYFGRMTLGKANLRYCGGTASSVRKVIET